MQFLDVNKNAIPLHKVCETLRLVNGKLKGQR